MAQSKVYEWTFSQVTLTAHTVYMIKGENIVHQSKMRAWKYVGELDLVEK
jgi:hypothetical protein